MLKIDKVLMDLIHEEGPRGVVAALAAALRVYADEMSDMRLKEKALEAAEAADFLSDL